MKEQMKGWVLHGINNIRWETVETPDPAEKEVIVSVKAAGICGSDIPRIYSTGAHVHPVILGHEFSGTVVSVGTGVESGWLGQRVGIFPLIPCGTCEPCRKKKYEMCRNYSYLGSRQDGGFAKYVAVPLWNLLRLPDTVSCEAAAMLEPMAVAVHAVRRARLSSSDTVVVCGLGTIGLLLLMFLMEQGETAKAGGGQKILAIGTKNAQIERAVKMGLPKECCLNAEMEDVGKWLREHTDGKGTDVFFECVGKNETVARAIDNAAPAGRAILIGNPYSEMKFERSVYWKILRNQLTVMGVWNSSFAHESTDDWHYVLERLSRGRIDPTRLISHRLPMEKLEYGMRMMRDKTGDYGKIMGVF